LNHNSSGPNAQIRVVFFLAAALCLVVIIVALVFALLFTIFSRYPLFLVSAALLGLYLFSHWEQFEKDSRDNTYVQRLFKLDLLKIMKNGMGIYDPPPPVAPSEVSDRDDRADHWWLDMRAIVKSFLEQGLTPIVVASETQQRQVKLLEGQEIVASGELERLRRSEEQLIEVRRLAQIHKS
jgi:hypothetical protein